MKAALTAKIVGGEGGTSTGLNDNWTTGVKELP